MLLDRVTCELRYHQLPSSAVKNDIGGAYRIVSIDHLFVVVQVRVASRLAANLHMHQYAGKRFSGLPH